MRHMKFSLAVGLGLAAGAGPAWAEGPTALPEVVVHDTALREEQPVGPYDQPEWTTQRRFTTTRVYLQQPPWSMGFEQWVRSKYYEGDRGAHRIQEEVEIGLPHRFQIDLYDNWEMTKSGTLYHDNVAGEVRYALADWGKLPMNPTVYAEYKLKDEGADVAEFKLLLGDEFGHGWHWGANAAYEFDLGGERTEELAGSLALSRTVIDRKLGLGLEALYASESVKGDRHNPENSLNLGPSVQWRPTAKTHLDLVAMAGLTDDAPDLLTYLVFGVDFGSGHEPARAAAPVSIRGN